MNEDDIENEDNLKNEDNLNVDNPKNEEGLKLGPKTHGRTKKFGFVD